MNGWQPSHLTAGQKEERRLVAARLFRAGRLKPSEIARHLGVSRAAVSQWRRAWRTGGDARLKTRSTGHRPARLTAAEWRRLGRILDRGAVASGFETEQWTLKRIAHVIARALGVSYHYRYLERPLKAHGYSVQRPASQARERDEQLVAEWLCHTWPALKKKARREGRTIALWDETGHSFRIRMHQTWARRDVTPVIRRRSGRREVSSIVVITPDGRLYARHQRDAVKTPAVLSALIYFRRQLATPLLIIWDRLHAHRSREVVDFVAQHSRDYAIAYLPAYAPELNPEEQANAWVKRELANALPDSVADLAALARTSFRRLQHQPVLIRHFFEHAGLHVKS